MNRILLLVASWVGRGVALRLSTLRHPKTAEILALRERFDRLRAENDLLRSRLLKIQSYSRPHFQPWQRLASLWHRSRYGLSLEATAQAFVISQQAILNWMRDVHRPSPKLVHPQQPLNALPDLVREITHHLRRQWPHWGTRRMAGVLARLGLQASRTSVQMILSRPPPKTPTRKTGGVSRPVKAIRPGHVYVLDFTQIGGFFRSTQSGPSSTSSRVGCWSSGFGPGNPALPVRRGYFKNAIDRGGRPAWVISDRRRQFKSRRFRGFLKRAGTRRRHAALGDANLSKIDRFWRSMKDEVGRGLLLFRPTWRLQKKLEDYVRGFNTERPHVGLNHRSPEDVTSGAPLAPRKIRSGRLEVRFLNGDREPPIFRLRDAA